MGLWAWSVECVYFAVTVLVLLSVCVKPPDGDLGT